MTKKRLRNGPHTDQYADIPRTSNLFAGPRLETPTATKKELSPETYFLGRPVTGSAELVKVLRSLGSDLIRIFEFEEALVLPLAPRNVMIGMSRELANQTLIKLQAETETAGNTVPLRTGAVYVMGDNATDKRLVSLSLGKPVNEIMSLVQGEISLVSDECSRTSLNGDVVHSIRIAETHGDEAASKVASIARNFGFEGTGIILEPPTVCTGPVRI